jgi:5'-3' exonuclease
VQFGRRDEHKNDKSEAQKLLDAQGFGASAINPADEWVYAKPLQALHVSILREYLQVEFQCLQHTLPFKYDFERVIDDFVFLCFFVGESDRFVFIAAVVSERFG